MDRPQPGRGGRVALIGLDGATFRVLDPLAREGVIPTLASLRERGAEAALRSTVPVYTPPAWISIATGVNPGRHGVYGFLDNTPQERAKISHSGSIKALTMWKHLSDLGVKVGILNVPMSYPPVRVNGFMVAGGLASGWTDPSMPNFASDEETGRLVNRIADGKYPLDVPVNYEVDWRSPEVIGKLHRAQELRRKVLGQLIERDDPEVVFAVFEGPDRVQHVHYQYLVEGSDWFDRPEAPRIREDAWRFYAEVDAGVRDLVEWAGPDGHVVIVSDHGFGPWEKTANLNILLSEWGYLALPGMSRLTRSRVVAGPLQRVARRVLPKSVLVKAKTGVGRRIDWPRTQAFTSHVAEQGIHVNDRDLPFGWVEEEDVRRIGDEIAERLMELRDPEDGQPVTDVVMRREEVVHGPYAGRAPHLFPFFRGQRYEVSDTLAAGTPFTDHRDRPWGYHHIDGVFIAAGPGVEHRRLDDGLDIVDVLPTTLHLGGYAIPEGLDGRVAEEALSGAARARPAEIAAAAAGPDDQEEYPFSEEEEAQIEESLRGLGYIE